MAVGTHDRYGITKDNSKALSLEQNSNAFIVMAQSYIYINILYIYLFIYNKYIYIYHPFHLPHFSIKTSSGHQKRREKKAGEAAATGMLPTIRGHLSNAIWPLSCPDRRVKSGALGVTGEARQPLPQSPPLRLGRSSQCTPRLKSKCCRHGDQGKTSAQLIPARL